jgi:hypothetical protein
MSPAAAVLLWAAAHANTLESWDLQDSDGGLVSGGETGQWAWGEVASGPGSGADGTHAWGTVLDGPHLNDAVDTLTLPSFDLSGVARPVLTFTHWYALDTAGDGDAAWVEVWGQSGWQRIEPVYGYPTPSGFTGESQGWQAAWFDLTGLADLSDVRLVLSADVSVSLDGWYIDALRLADGDAVPPAFKSVSGPGEEVELGPEIPLQAEVRDDIAVSSVEVLWRTEGEPVDRAALTRAGGDLWTGGIPAVPPDSRITWWLRASDGTNTADTIPQQTRVYLPAPTGLTGPDERVVARSVRVQWTPPTAAFPRVDHVVFADGEPVVETTGSVATVPVSRRDPEITVRARYDTPFGVVEGDDSPPLVVDLAYPQVTTVSPAEGYQGDEMRIELQGVDLFLAQGAAAASLGEGVTPTELDVVDVNTAIIGLRIDEDAAPGPRDLLLLTDDAGVPLASAFTVLAGADRPTVLSVEPSAIEQGDRETLVLRLSEPPSGAAADLRIDAGPGVVVESVSAEGAVLTATVAATADAPLGERAVEVDDGVRLISGAWMRVRAPAAGASGVCGPAALPAAAGPLLVAFGALLVRRRRLRAPPARD